MKDFNMKNNKFIKKTDNVFVVLLILILIASTILMKKSKYDYLIQTSIVILTILYIIIRKIQNESISLINNKLDLMVLVFITTAFLPIIFKTYISISTALTIALGYVSLYCLYIMVKHLYNRQYSYITCVNMYIILQAILFVLIGLENLTTNQILPRLGITNITNGEMRLVSLFGNPNVLSAYLVFAFFITIHKSTYEERTNIKLLLNATSLIIIIGIILTYSKAIYLIFPIIIIMYMVIIRNKQKNIEILINIISTVLISIIYVSFFNQLISIEQYVYIWLFLLLSIIINILSTLCILKINKYFRYIKVRYIILAMIVLIIMTTIFINTELKHIIPYNVFNNSSESDYETKKINNVKGNTEYTLKFDIDANAYTQDIKNIEDMFEINVIERDSKNYEINNKCIKFGNYKGEKTIKILTRSNTRELKIEFKAKYKYINRNLVINKFIINEEEIPLQYKMLSVKLVDKIKDISLNYKTAQERLQFIKDAIKLSKDNFITGIGGECWQYKYGQVQDYDYTSSDIHSYPIQILLEFGIVGFITLILIYIYIMTIKVDKTQYLGIKFGLLAIFIHSAIDSEMKILFMRLLIFTYFAIFSCKSENKIEIKKKVNEILNIGVVVLLIITVFLLLNPSLYFVNTTIGSRKDLFSAKRNRMEIAEYYEKNMKYEKYNNINNETGLLIQYIKDKKVDKIEVLYEKIKNEQCEWKQKPEIIIAKSLNIVEIIKNIEDINDSRFYEWIIKFAELQVNEREQTMKMLKEALEKKYITLDSDNSYSMLKEANKYIDDIIEKYKLGVPIINYSDNIIPDPDILEKTQINIKSKNIIIYHTHTTEAYYASEKYKETETSKTLNEQYNVLAVGETLKSALNKKGYNSIQLREYNDLPSVDGSYTRSKKVLIKNLKNTKSKIIFDLHRDAGKVGKMRSVIKINNEDTANIRFVIASEHENWIKNLKWAIEIQKKADEIYPGLFKPILVYDSQYNQDVSEYATLVEIGGDGNTVEEAKNGVRCLADILEKVLEM